MTAEELIELMSERPFKPLRLHLTNGRTYEIRHPEMAVVSDTVVAIGVPKQDGSLIAEKITHCSLPHVVEVEPADAASP